MADKKEILEELRKSISGIAKRYGVYEDEVIDVLKTVIYNE